MRKSYIFPSILIGMLCACGSSDSTPLGTGGKAIGSGGTLSAGGKTGGMGGSAAVGGMTGKVGGTVASGGMDGGTTLATRLSCSSASACSSLCKGEGCFLNTLKSRTECTAVNDTCAGTCGSGCNIQYENGAKADVTVIAGGIFECDTNATCNVAIDDPGAAVECTGGSTCNIKCKGACTYACRKGATCSVICGTDAALKTMVDGTCPPTAAGGGAGGTASAGGASGGKGGTVATGGSANTGGTVANGGTGGGSGGTAAIASLCNGSGCVFNAVKSRTECTAATDTCSGTCGAGCVVQYENGAKADVTVIAGGIFECDTNATCNIAIEDPTAMVECTGGATCNITCKGACNYVCKGAKGAKCKVTCAGAAAIETTADGACP